MFSQLLFALSYFIFGIFDASYRCFNGFIISIHFIYPGFGQYKSLKLEVDLCCCCCCVLKCIQKITKNNWGNFFFFFKECGKSIFRLKKIHFLKPHVNIRNYNSTIFDMICSFQMKIIDFGPTTPWTPSAKWTFKIFLQLTPYKPANQLCFNRYIYKYNLNNVGPPWYNENLLLKDIVVSRMSLIWYRVRLFAALIYNDIGWSISLYYHFQHLRSVRRMEIREKRHKYTMLVTFLLCDSEDWDQIE